MTEEEVQAKIQRAIRLTERLLAARPDDNDLLRAKAGLVRASEMVLRHWPLSAEEKKQINLGMYAIRVLDGGPYGELPDLLMELDTNLKQG
jgi:hypothetical protein